MPAVRPALLYGAPCPNSRSGKVDVTELLILSLALDIPPVLLLFDQFPDGQPVEVSPCVEAVTEDAVRWVTGRISSPRKLVRHTLEGRGQIIRVGFEDRTKPRNDGVKLIAAAFSLDKALEDRNPLMIQLDKAQNGGGEVDAAQRILEIHDEHIEAIQQEIRDSRDAVWGLMSESDRPERESND